MAKKLVVVDGKITTQGDNGLRFVQLDYSSSSAYSQGKVKSMWVAKSSIHVLRVTSDGAFETQIANRVLHLTAQCGIRLLTEAGVPADQIPTEPQLTAMAKAKAKADYKVAGKPTPPHGEDSDDDDE